MTTPELLVPALEDELDDVVDAFVSVLASADRIDTDGAAAVGALEAYLACLNRAAVAVERCHTPGLHNACVLMSANLLDLVSRATPLSSQECDLLYAWPGALADYRADPLSNDSVAGLVAIVSSPIWPSPLSADEADALHQMIVADNADSGGLALPPYSGATSEPGGDDIAHIRSSTGSLASDETRASTGDLVSRLAHESFSEIPHSTRVAWIADLAAHKELVGMQEVCDRVGRAVAQWEAQERGVSDLQCTLLDEVYRVARCALMEGYGATLADRLVALVADPAWPEALSDDEKEMVRELLQADALACGPVAAASAATARDGHPAEPPVAGAEAELEPDGSDDGWLAEQVVSAELVALLADEYTLAADSLRLAIDSAFLGDDAGNRDALDQCAEEVGRMAAAADAVGLRALPRFLAMLKRLIVQHSEAPRRARQHDMLNLLPGALAAYLAAPNDPSTAEGLVDLQRSDAWPTPIAPGEASLLVQGLCLVTVSHDVAAAPARPTQAAPGDASLAFPEGINQELLDGLLQELPLQTCEFSTAIQNIAGGRGGLRDLDAARRAAHTLKGAANTVGVLGIANLTHHLEDILVALATHQVMPSRTLAECLIRAADCLEAMSEAVAGAGPEPEDALAVLQEVLNWANRIDVDGVPAIEDATDPAPLDDAATVQPARPTPPAAAAAPMVRVPAALIDELLRLVGESIISTGQIRDRLAKVARHHQASRDQVGALLRLTHELEDLVDVGGGAGPARAKHERSDFDPLEFEHFSELHTVSRRLIESATDTREMGLGMDDDLAELKEVAEAQERLHQQAQSVVMQTRMVPVSTVLSRLQRGVRQACRLLDKEATLQVSGSQTLIDSNILNELIDPLMHVLRNAVDHGIEPVAIRASAGKPASGHIDLAFAREGNQVVVRCRDDGNGLDLASIRRVAQAKGLMTPDQTLPDDELARLILAPGFSTRDEATQVSGRGIGMDIVRTRIQQLKGSLTLHTRSGEGLTVEMRLPAALISTHALIVRVGAKRLAVSSHGIQDIRYVMADQLQVVAGVPTYRIGDNQLQLLELEALLGLPFDRRLDSRGGFPLLVVRLDSGALRAVRAQEVLQSRDLVVKTLGRYVPKLRGVVGATILGDGSVAAVVDLPDVMASPDRLPRGTVAPEADALGGSNERVAAAQLTALVVDDSLSARRATAQFMKDAGFEVRTAIDGLEAVSILAKWTPDVMLVDMEMPRMTGLELTTHVRASSGPVAQVPIIMITSRSTAKHRKLAESAGVSVYLTKPFADEELLRHVTHLTMARHG